MSTFVYTIINTKLGKIGIASTNKGICNITFLKNERTFITSLKKKYRGEFKNDDAHFRKIINDLNEYISGKRKELNWTLDIIEGTEFQRKVWTILRTIPYGEVRSYKWVAEITGFKNAYRAVGNAVGKNPLPIVIPCHRVIRENGELGGFSGGIMLKKRLLNIEDFL